MRNAHTLFILALIGAQSLGLSLVASAPAEDKPSFRPRGTVEGRLARMVKSLALFADGDELRVSPVRCSSVARVASPYRSLAQTPLDMLACYDRYVSSASSSATPDDDVLSPEDYQSFSDDSLVGLSKIGKPLKHWLDTAVILCVTPRETNLQKVIWDGFVDIFMRGERVLHPQYLQDIGDYFLGISHKKKIENLIPLLTRSNWSEMQRKVDSMQSIARARLFDLTKGKDFCRDKRTKVHEDIVRSLTTYLSEPETFYKKSSVLFEKLAEARPYELRRFSTEFRNFLRNNISSIAVSMRPGIDALTAELSSIEEELLFDDHDEIEPLFSELSLGARK